MKRTTIFLAGFAMTLLGSTLFNLSGQTTDSEYSIIKRGPNDRVWERSEMEYNSTGDAVPKKHRYTELATGLNHWKDGEWMPSSEEIDVAPDGDFAVATNGQHQVYFPGNIRKGIQLVTPSGKVLWSQPMALGYFDGKKSILLSELANANGEVLPSGNQVRYRDAFARVGADMLYTYTLAGFEQDVILKQQLPNPASLGLDPTTTRLQMFTEFIDPPEPHKKVRLKGDKSLGGLTDTTLDFGGMEMGPGQAFSTTDSLRLQVARGHFSRGRPVYKTWVHVEGRTFLIEELPYDDAWAMSQKLPPGQEKSDKQQGASLGQVWPAKLARNETKPGLMRMASAGMKSEEAVVLDYFLVNNSQTNSTFTGDGTYLISGPCVLSGTTTIEGGAVIKLDGTNSSSLQIDGPLDCKTGPYHPAVLTDKNDDSVGEAITTNSITPVTQTSGYYLRLTGDTNYTVKNVRFSYAQTGLWLDEPSTYSADVWDCQFVSCQTGASISATNDVMFHNVLFGLCGAATSFGGGSELNGEQVTISGNSLWNTNATAPTTINLTNSIVVGGVGAGVSLNTNDVVINPGSSVFQTVGAGNYYLTNNTYRAIGTTNITPALLTELRQKTTRPPSVYSWEWIDSNLTLSQAVARDTNAAHVDLGYHYDTLDYYFDGFNVLFSGTLTLTNGVQVGFGGPFYLEPVTTLKSQGKADQLNRLVQCRTVQETATNSASDPTLSVDSVYYSINVSCRFTDFSRLAGPGGHISDDYKGGTWNFRDCQFHGAQVSFMANIYPLTVGMTNCLLDNTKFYAGGTNLTLRAVNNLFYQEDVWLGSSYAPNSFTFRDDFFCRNSLTNGITSGTLTYDHNGYVTNYTQLGTGTGDVVVTNFTFQSSWLGDFYQPVDSPLIDQGYTNANVLGLYHYTTQTNQTKEYNSTADIGYHYVATDSSGKPVDSNGDGNPDYLQDANGNGIKDGSETQWAVAPTITTQPANQTTIVGEMASFSATATGTAPLHYQWFFNDTNLLVGQTNNYLFFGNAQTTNSGNYKVEITNPAGSAISSNALLTVTTLMITSQPQNQTVVQGANATFTLTAISTLPLDYQWYFNGTNAIPWSNTSNYTKVVVVPADAGNYSVTVSNAVESVTSSNAVLTVIVPPIITQEPTNLTVNLTSNATFNVQISTNSTTPLTYQWLWNGSALAGATNISFTVTNVQLTNVGFYSIIVSNAAGVNTSMPASLTATLLAPDFTNSTALKLNGNAVFTNTGDGRVLELTRSTDNQAGSAFFLTPVSLANEASFSTFFSFRLSKSGGIYNSSGSDNHNGADGIVFVAQTLTNNVGSLGGGMGYYGVTNSVGVEFDTWWNSGDPTFDPLLPAGQTNANGTTGDGNHVGIDYNGFLTNAITPYGTNGYWAVYRHVTNDMNDGNIWFAWVDYDGTNIELRLSETDSSRPQTPYLTNAVDLINYLQTSNTYLGFTAGTGGAYNQQDILKWQFISPYHPIGVTNFVPVVNITSPTNGMIFEYGPPIALQATASEQGGTITNVIFLAGTDSNNVTNLLGTAVIGTDNAFGLAWTNTLDGTNTVVAVAWDANGISTTSAVVSVVMNLAPNVSAGPNQTLVWSEDSAGNSIVLAGSVSDDGYPYGTFSASWSLISGPGTATFYPDNGATNATVVISTNGVYVFELTGDDGFVAQSNQCTVTVSLPTNSLMVQILSPTNQTFIARTNVTITVMASNSISGDPVNWVEFFAGTNILGYASSTNNIYQMVWFPVSGGTYVLTAEAFDTNGATGWSRPVTNYVRSLPAVEIDAPANGQTFSESPTNITISATASADGATISSVMFYQGTNLLGSDSTSPYSVTWDNVTNGTYKIFARVTDSLGASGVSSNIFITVEPVNQPPLVNAGPGQTNFFSTNAVQLSGLVSDDGLPLNGMLTVTWTNLSGPGNVTFVNSNEPVTEVYFSEPGDYALQLSACDGQYTTSSNVTIAILASNEPPAVFAGTNQTIVLPATSTNVFGTLYQIPITSEIPNPNGIDYFGKSNCVIVSVNYSSGNPFNFELVSSNGDQAQFSSLSNLSEEVYISTVRSTIGGFKIGEMFTGNGVPGQIMRIEPDGTTIGNIPWTNNWNDQEIVQSNAWLVLPTLTLSNGATISPGLLRGGVWVDRTGVWGGDLIVSTEACDDTGQNQDPSPVGYVWRVNSRGQATFIAQLVAQPNQYVGGPDTFEGVTTCPNDPVKYGPLAGCVLVGGDSPGDFFAVNTNGFVVRYNFPFGAEDIRIVPRNENFFGCQQGGGIYGISANQFSGMVGDIMVVDEFDNKIYRLQWNGKEFETYSVLANPPGGDTEGANFAPAGLYNLPSAGWVQLNGSVTDDGELFSPTSNSWSVVSGPTNSQVEFSDPELTNTTVNISMPGTYVLKLTAYDGQFTISSNVTITVIQNQAPWVFAGTNQFVSTNVTELEGIVTNITLPPPYNVTNIVWTEVSGPGSISIASSNQAQTTVTFDSWNTGVYVLALTADDGQATNTAYVTINYLAPANILTPGYVITPTNDLAALRLQFVDQTNEPITNSLIQYQSVSGPNLLSGYLLTDSNGYASLVYTNMSSSPGPDVFEFTSSNYTEVTAFETNYWAYNTSCGDEWDGQNLSQSSDFSIAPWADGYHYADYYIFNDNAGDTNHFGLTCNPDSNGNLMPLIMFLRDASNQVVAVSEATQSGGGASSTFLTYAITNSGQYTLEVAAIYDADQESSVSYNLSVNCSDYVNEAPQMGILYNGTNVANGSTLFLPSTAAGSPTNIDLEITNFGNLSFEITNVTYAGDFALSNDLTGATVSVGGWTNLGVIFNASSNETSFGSLVLSANDAGGSNYIVYLIASTSPTGAAPSIKLTWPPNGSTFLDGPQSYVPFTAVVTPGSAEIQPGTDYSTYNPVLLNLNTDGYSGYYEYPLFQEDGLQTYTNQLINYSEEYSELTVGDFSYSAQVTDVNGMTATAPPVLIHIVPFYSSDPTKAPAIEVWYDGANVLNGDTIVFPQTSVGTATNISLVISNSGNYYLGINSDGVAGDFAVPNEVAPCVILPGAQTNFQVTFNASTLGDNYGQLALADNVIGGGNFVINLIGSANGFGYVPPATNSQPPVAQDDQVTVAANSANNILDPLANDTDSNGYPITIVSLSTPGNGGTASIINNGTKISYTPPAGVRSYPGSPADGFSYTISDGHGGTAKAGIYVIIDAGDIPVVSLTASNSVVTAGEGDLLTADIANTPDVVKVDFFQGNTLIGEVTNGVNGSYVLNWTATYDANSDSASFIEAAATDRFGQVGISPSIQITVNAPTNGTVAATLDTAVGYSGTNTLTSTNLALIRDGIFDVYGEAYHTEGSNVVWQLGLYTLDGTLVRNLTSGSNSVTSMSSPLARCDLTSVQNGAYDLRLTVSGGYQTIYSSVRVGLNSSLKIGQFGFSQQDLAIPVNGISLTVTRTYNSLNPNKGDFGYGWTYDLGSLDLSLDETREDTQDVAGDTFSQRTGGGRDVTLTLPDGRRVTFQFTFDGPYGTDSKYYPKWIAPPGVNYTLTAMDNPYYDSLNGAWNNESGVGFESFDFKGFYLTARDNTTYVISRPDLDDHFLLLDSENGFYLHAYGQPYLSQIIQRNGDTVTINSDSVVFASTNGATNQIMFERNTDGLITSVSDPNGQTSSGPPAVKYEYDSNDNLIRVLNLVDAGTGAYVTNAFSYTNASFPHYITGIINADGTQVAKNFYDDSGKLTAVQDADGNLTQFIHNETNNSEVIIDRLGYTNTYVYDLRGNVVVQTNQLGQVTAMAYDDDNNKTNDVVFLDGQPYATNRYAYDTNDLLLVSTDPLGHTNSFTYDSFGNLTVSTDAEGHSSTNNYDPNTGQMISMSDALGQATTNFYNGDLLAGTRDAIGTVTTNYYDPNENLIAMATLDASGVILSSNTFTYDENLNRLTSTVWRQVNGVWTPAMTSYSYDAMNRVIQTIAPDGGTNTVIYDATGKQQATIDPLGRETDYTYDSQGRLTQTTYPDQTTTKSVYDANGNRVKSIDQENRTTAYIYDALNRLVETIYPDNTTNATIYDGVGRVAQTIDARGTITAFAYDAVGRRLAVTNAFGISDIQTVSSYRYDANGNQITFTDGNGHTTTNVFDALNRQVETDYTDGTKAFTGYDADGRRVAQTNQDGVVTRFGYDGAGRLMAATNAFGATGQTFAHYEYDEAGNEVAQIDALNRTNTFAYDGMGRRILHTRADPTDYYSPEGFTYDLAGNLVAHTNFYGFVIVNQYDEMNRLTNNTDLYNFGYSYSYTATGQRQSMVDYRQNISSTTYTYDSRDRLIRKVVDWGNGYYVIGSLNYLYDANGNVTNMQSGFANGVNLAYGYDALNRLTNVMSRGQLAARYCYDSAGNLQSMRYGNGVTNQYQYDSLNRLTNQVWNNGNTPLAAFAYQLKRGGTRTNLVETIGAQAQTAYAWSYDNLYRLTNEVINSLGSVSYAYDAVGNRTNRSSSISGLGDDSYYTYDTNDVLTADAYGTYGNDQNGNTTSAPGASWGYGYDQLNRVASFGWNGYSSIVYDGDGNRVEKDAYNPSIGSLLTYYLVDDRNPSGYPQVVEEYTNVGWTGGTVLTRVYNYGLGLISQQQFDSATHLPSTLSYYGYDGHSSVRFLMDTNGDITDTYTYDAYGTLIASTGNTPNNYLYCGQQYDWDMGLYYNRARYFNPGIGRFMGPDGDYGNNEDPLSLHKYLYCEANPVDNGDPSGHEITQDELKEDILKGGNAAMEGVKEALKVIADGGSHAEALSSGLASFGAAIVPDILYDQVYRLTVIASRRLEIETVYKQARTATLSPRGPIARMLDQQDALQVGFSHDDFSSVHVGIAPLDITVESGKWIPFFVRWHDFGAHRTAITLFPITWDKSIKKFGPDWTTPFEIEDKPYFLFWSTGFTYTLDLNLDEATF